MNIEEEPSRPPNGGTPAVVGELRSQSLPGDNLDASLVPETRAIERRRKQEQIRATINQKLIETGERERLEELLKTKLIDCGWRDELKTYCKEVIKNKGLEKISVEELVAEITPRGRATVPDSIKAELLNRIRRFLQTN